MCDEGVRLARSKAEPKRTNTDATAKEWAVHTQGRPVWSCENSFADFAICETGQPPISTRPMQAQEERKPLVTLVAMEYSIRFATRQDSRVCVRDRPARGQRRWATTEAAAMLGRQAQQATSSSPDSLRTIARTYESGEGVQPRERGTQHRLKVLKSTKQRLRQG